MATLSFGTCGKTIVNKSDNTAHSSYNGVGWNLENVVLPAFITMLISEIMSNE